MADKVQFELVSPEKILLSEPVDMVVVPGTEGNFGVLPGHAPLISSVRPGVIDVHKDGKVAEQIFIAGGFAEVTPLRCTVLADAAISVGSIDRTAAEAELVKAREGLSSLRDAGDRGGAAEIAALQAADRAFRVATAKLDALAAAAKAV